MQHARADFYANYPFGAKFLRKLPFGFTHCHLAVTKSGYLGRNWESSRKTKDKRQKNNQALTCL